MSPECLISDAPCADAVGLIDQICSPVAEVRDAALDAWCRGKSADQLLAACAQLDQFRRQRENLYERVRALFFLYAIHRFHLPAQLPGREIGSIPFAGFESLLQRRFHEAVDSFLAEQSRRGPSVTLSSALASAYHRLAFQTLSDQVRRSVRTVRGNQWMFRTGHPQDLSLRIRQELRTPLADGSLPILLERTSVRMDFSHSGWSDIFFLGMDFPEGARVINASIDLAVEGRHEQPQPPIESAIRVIDQPVLRLVSIDLDASAEISRLVDVYDFGKDYLGLLKAAIIAAGLIPPGMEGCDVGIEAVLGRLVGPGLGLEIVSRVNDIPKGSRLAVSTNLLGSLIAVCMRATGQVSQLTGSLSEADRRIVAARAILGEWLGGSGGGWQDSGGIWPGIKMLAGAKAEEGDSEYGISRGCLLPRHHVFSDDEVTPATRGLLQDSLILVHGGMAQNVGPILEMVTEKYLLRSEDEWAARREAMAILDEITAALKAGDIRRVGGATHRNFTGPLQRIIPWCSNRYTESLIEQCQERYADDFWGFWMLGGMAGGGMGFIFAPERKEEASQWLADAMLRTKRKLESSLPFAMDPVVYKFAINDRGTCAELHDDSHLPRGYYALMVPRWLRENIQQLTPQTRSQLERVGQRCREASGGELAARLLDRMLPSVRQGASESEDLDQLLRSQGFDPIAHEQIRADLLSGRLGLSQNRLPATAQIEDVHPEEIQDARRGGSKPLTKAAQDVISGGGVAVVTLAAGVGSRWTQGAGVVKALHPFHKFGGVHRTFLEVHLAKSRRAGSQFGSLPTHVFTTGYLTEGPIRQSLSGVPYAGRVEVVSGRSVGLRMIPTLRDLHFAWEEMPQQVLDQQQEKMRQSGRNALLEWASAAGEASDYRDNVPKQCLHPVGHWYEIANMLRSGVLGDLLAAQPQLRYLLLHNIDTLGATIDPVVLGLHMASGACLSFEVITRRLEDRGGGLAKVDGRIR
ncbi:MAG: UTP--glucose-1-phosphate uridylyltransferase, partial [Aureliella sp.]